MKTLIVKDNIHGRQTKVNAKTTYQTVFGKWIAEVDGSELRRACLELCNGIKNCSCENMHGEADQDDDGIITVSELFSYISRKVPQASDQDQHPVKKGETEGELVIGRVK